MCLLCIELAKDTFNKNDFLNNYLELVLTDPAHAGEIVEKFEEKFTEDLFEME